MADDDDDLAEKRRHPRHTLKRGVRAASEIAMAEGNIVDISAGGAAIEIKSNFEAKEEVELEIEDLGKFGGSVVRAFADGIAVEFDMEDEDEDQLLSKLEQLSDAMRIDDE